MRLRSPRLTLLTRFTLFAAGAVAVVALTIAGVAYLVIRADLESQVHASLAYRATAVQHQAARIRGNIPYGWVPARSSRFGASVAYTQVITATGDVWAPDGSDGELSPDAASFSVAAGEHAAYYYDTTVQGAAATVLTTPLRDGLALQVAEPIGATRLEVDTAGTVLGVLSLIGVAVATVLGVAVARAGLAPVARLAAVAEEVSQTADPSRRVEVGRRDELGRLAATVNRMLGALERSQATQRQLVSDASHELRTPLASMRINVELLQDTPGMPEEERKEVLGRVVAQVAELSDLVSSVTELARGQYPEDTHTGVRLDEIAASALDAARRDWPNADFQADLEKCTVTGSADRLRIAIRNLLDNAAKFGADAGPVQVRLRRLNGDAELTVRDHGPGIAPEDAPYVFDRFYRALQARSVPGSGLGLSVVSDMIHRHKGAIVALPAPDGGGTLMRMTLPTGPHPADR
ncbi:MAG TPA: HAMP domain-containing sensor histidine kinase [Trebonia sp.]